MLQTHYSISKIRINPLNIILQGFFMTKETVFSNAQIVLANRVMHANVVVRHKLIKEVDDGNIATKTPIDLEIDQYTFSTHAGHEEILEFAKECKAKHVVVYHTDPNHARPPLADALEAQGHQVHCPINGKSYTIVE